MDSTDRTLLLSQGYEPIKVISWQRAITLLSLGKIEVIEEHDRAVRSISLVIKIPAVVRLLRAFRRHSKPVKFSRINIYARDGYRCQYCGDTCSIRTLTFDHVVPRARGGRTAWDNIVSCCLPCNRDKGSRTPAEAGLTLRQVPKRPDWITAVTIQISTASVPAAWRDYLYWTGSLEDE